MATRNAIKLATTYYDLADNAGTAAASANYSVKTVPTASIKLSNTTLMDGKNAIVTIAFSEPVKDFTISDLTTPNGSLTELKLKEGSSNTWTAIFTPTDGVLATRNAIKLATTYYDLADNAGTAAASANYSVDTKSMDTTPPTVSITLINNKLSAGETTSVIFKFSEAVKGVSLSSFVAENGKLSPLSTKDNITWTATLTPADNASDASNMIGSGKNDITDFGGNALKMLTSETYEVSTKTEAQLAISDAVAAFDGRLALSATFAQAAYDRDNGAYKARQSLEEHGWTPLEFNPDRPVPKDLSKEPGVYSFGFDLGFVKSLANVYVATSKNENGTEIFVAYAGSNDSGDWLVNNSMGAVLRDFGEKSNYNEKLDPFNAALVTYVNSHNSDDDPSNDISRVTVVGHSLGGTAVQELFREITTSGLRVTAANSALYWGVTFGSPGHGWVGDDDDYTKQHLLQLENKNLGKSTTGYDGNDPVPWWGSSSDVGAVLAVDYQGAWPANYHDGFGSINSHGIVNYVLSAATLDAAPADIWEWMLGNKDYSEVALVGINGGVSVVLG